MIFVTVGTQLPFDRLLDAVDQWAQSAFYTGESIVAQIGPSDFRSSRMETVERLGVAEFKRFASECRVMVSHAGMGSILSAMSYRKPLVMMARAAHLGEHRNDHQLATAKRFGQRDGVSVIDGAGDLHSLLAEGLLLKEASASSPYASAQLISHLQAFIHDGTCSRGERSRVGRSTERTRVHGVAVGQRSIG